MAISLGILTQHFQTDPYRGTPSPVDKDIHEISGRLSFDETFEGSQRSSKQLGFQVLAGRMAENGAPWREMAMALELVPFRYQFQSIPIISNQLS